MGPYDRNRTQAGSLCTLVSRVLAVGSWASRPGGPLKRAPHSGEQCSIGFQPVSELNVAIRVLAWAKLSWPFVRYTPLFFQAECGVLGNVIRIDQNAVNGLLFVLTGFSVFNVLIRLINS